MRTADGTAGDDAASSRAIMARLPRIDVAGIPQHVVVRGVDRQPCFRATGDFAAYLDDLRQATLVHACTVHAYVLMTNHVHLLLTGEAQRAVSAAMQSVGRRYVRRFNASWKRTGTLFEGRFRASLVESEQYLINCMRYIELNPVRAGMVSSPLAYPWSSARANVGERDDPLVTRHPEYRRLGCDAAEQAAAYRVLLAQKLEGLVVRSIREHVNKSCVLGSPTFQHAIAARCGRKVHVRSCGREPRRA